MTVQGYDISSVQGKLAVSDFQAMVAQGISFIIAKCYQGNDYIDPYYHSNVANAQAAGLQVAAYQFIYPLPPNGVANRDPVSQANLHFNAAGPGVLGMCDAEWPAPQDFAAWGCTSSQINQWVLTYLQTYSQLMGRLMPVYSYPYWCQAVGFSSEIAQYPLWIASYEPTPQIPAPWSSWVCWQTTGGGGRLPNGAPVDTDVAPDLSLWGIPGSVLPVGTPLPPPGSGGTPTPNPTPTPPSSFGNGNVWTSIGNTVSQLFSRCKK